jgi:hypothetical protein
MYCPLCKRKGRPIIGAKSVRACVSCRVVYELPRVQVSLPGASL